MSIEGIFRRNGNIRRLKDLTEAIDHDPSSVDLTQDNPVQLAALLKKFLRDLPEPLMTYKLHRLLIASQCKFFYPVESDMCLIIWYSGSCGERTTANPPSSVLAITQEPSRHDGGIVRVPEMGGFICPHGRVDGEQDGLAEPGNCHLPKYSLLARAGCCSGRELWRNPGGDVSVGEPRRVLHGPRGLHSCLARPGLLLE